MFEIGDLVAWKRGYTNREVYYLVLQQYEHTYKVYRLQEKGILSDTFVFNRIYVNNHHKLITSIFRDSY